MKRKILWKRLLALVGAGLALCLLGIAALFTVGRPLLSTLRASMWAVDPARSREVAQGMLDYSLPEGYSETKLLSIQGYNAAVLVTHNQHPGNVIFLESLPEGIRENEDWRKRYEEGWSKDLDGHRYQVQTVEIREMQIKGARVPVRLLEGKDERGGQVKQAVCVLPGKVGDVLVAVMSSSGTWDFNLVEAFYRSIQ